MTIWKYPIESEGRFSMNLPSGAKFLSAHDQPGMGPQMWWLVDPSKPTTRREFALICTGAVAPEAAVGYPFLGTFLLNGGNFVLHLFEVTR